MRFQLFLLLALTPAAHAQVVFYDDFTGPELLPHWSTPPAHYWTYDFNNSMLNVTGLHYPNSPPSNYAIIGTSFAPQTDFRLDVWMGWELGDPPQRLNITVNGAPVPPWGPSILAAFMYNRAEQYGPEPLIWAGTTLSPAVNGPAPPPGIHQFTIIRAADEFSFFLNGQHFATVPDLTGAPAQGLSIEFRGAYAGQFGTFHVDRIMVVPAPGTVLLGLAVASLCIRRRRLTGHQT